MRVWINSKRSRRLSGVGASTGFSRRAPTQPSGRPRLSSASVCRPHHVLGDRPGDLRAVVIFHERQGQIDTGADARRCHHPPVTHEDGVRLDLHGRETQSQLP